MSKYKITYHKYEDWEADEMANYFSYMASQGWYFDKFYHGLRFKKGNSGKQEYSVVIFDRSGDDWGKNARIRDFIDYCEEAGWHFIDKVAYSCVFVKNREDAVEIFTNEEKFKQIKKFTKSHMIGEIIGSLIMVAVMLWLFRMYDSSFIIFNNFRIFLSVLFLIWAVGDPIVSFLYSLLIFRKTKQYRKQVETGENIFLGKKYKGKPSIALSQKISYFFRLSYALYASLMLMYFSGIYTVLYVYAVIVIGYILYNMFFTYSYKFNLEKLRNIVISIALAVVYLCAAVIGTMYMINHYISYDYKDTNIIEKGDDEGKQVLDYPEGTPLTFKDLNMNYDLNYYYYDEDKSVLGTMRSFDFCNNSNQICLSYKLYECKNSILANELYKDLYKEAKYRYDDGDKYVQKIENGFAARDYGYTLINKNTVFDIHIYNEDNDITNEKLDLIKNFISEAK